MGLARKRVLIVNCYIDEHRRMSGRPNFVPQAVGPVYLGAFFSPEQCELKLYSELYSGPLQDEELLGWPDMLVLTGMSTAYDRMLQLTAYVRTRNEKVIVVAGGPPIRALPRYSRQFFDYCCQGDIEEMKEVITEAFGAAYLAEQPQPRFDLINWLGHVGHVESSRNCNFRCSYCTLTGEGGAYQKYDLDYVRRQILAIGKRTNILFVDNNFYGNDHHFFTARMELLREMWKEGHFGGWSALVTGDFFLKEENLRLARESGCQALFSGVESFDEQMLRSYNKLQNTRIPQVEMIRRCLDAGILFLYGTIFDATARSLKQIHQEISFITGTPDITLPSFMNLAIPILGTPYFHECLAKGLFLPDTKLRDMDGNTLVTRPLDPMEDVVQFLIDLPSLRGYRRRVVRHSVGFYRRYRRVLDRYQMIAALGNAALLCLPSIAHNPLGNRRENKLARTYITTTEPAGPLYQPRFPVASRYLSHFKPTMVTDSAGRLREELVLDLITHRRVPERARRNV